MKILLATDGSDGSIAAAKLLLRLPLPSVCHVTLLTVVEDISALFFDPMLDRTDPCLDDFEATRQNQASHFLNIEAKRLQHPGWTLETVIRQGDPANDIIEVATKIDSDLLVIGSHGLGRIERFLIGSVSRKVVEYAPCSVLVARPEDTSTRESVTANPLRLLLALDGSASAQAALDRVVTMASLAPMDITLVSVLAFSRFYRMDVLEKLTDAWQTQKQAAQTQLDVAAATLRKLGANVSVELQEGNHVSDTLFSIADQAGTDIIMAGHKGHTRVERFLLGSVSRRLVDHASCSVWIHRGR